VPNILPPFKIKLRPLIGYGENIYVEVYLVLSFSNKYPFQSPTIELEKIKGLSDSKIKELKELLQHQSETFIGEPMIYQLALITQEFLSINNKEQLSFYDQMVQHQLQLRREEEKKITRTRK